MSRAPASPSRKRRGVTRIPTTEEKIHSLLRAWESNAPPPNYLEPVKGVVAGLTERQREKVVKYINELAEDFELCVQTGALACNYFDRYVASLASSTEQVTDKRLIQKIASTCLLVAAKFFDRRLPPLSELEKVHHYKAKAEEFANLELKVLSALQWKLHVPLPHAFVDFLRELCPNAPFDASIDERIHFFVDLSVYGYHFLQYSPAAIAAASMLTAWKFSEEHTVVSDHLELLAHAIELDSQQLSKCMTALVKYYAACFPENGKAAALQVEHFKPIEADLSLNGSTSASDTSETPPPTRCDTAPSPTLSAFGEEAISPRPPSEASSSGASCPPTPLADATLDSDPSAPTRHDAPRPLAPLPPDADAVARSKVPEINPDRATPDSIMAPNIA